MALRRAARETGVATLDRLGLLGPDLLAAHCVQVDPDEIALIGERGVRVAHCPRSNALLGCRIAPVTELRAAGAIVGIGTDSPASAPSFDMFDEIRAAVAFARAREQRTDVFSGVEALEVATLGGARALGLEEEIGSLVGEARRPRGHLLGGSPYAPVEDPPRPSRSVAGTLDPHRWRSEVPKGRGRLARADRRRDARSKPVAASAERYQSAYVGTDALFFQRLRRQAKWVFVFLAFIFAFSFVVFGVGSEVPGGVADILQGGGGGSADVGGARERTQENPGDADAWRDLATALQQDGRPEEAIAPLERYVTLEPKDADALGSLASLYIIRANNLGEQLRARRRRRRWTTRGRRSHSRREALPSGRSSRRIPSPTHSSATRTRA